MSKYHNDQPIKGDQNDPDLLNRVGFAKHLAEILLLKYDDDCLTVSLEGGWGYGKTSVINLVKVALKEKEQSPIIIEYNPWLAGKPESLIQDFLLQFSSQLSISDNSKIALEAARGLVSYSSLFSVAKLVPGAEPWASIIRNVLSASGNSIKEIAELKKLDLLGKKKKVIEAITKIEKPVVVIIDDIDRLTPLETFQVLRLIKAVADFSGTAFLLAFDPDYLTSVLNKNDIINSSEYINKVIQLRVPLPVISERAMNELAKVELKNLSEKNLTQSFEDDDGRLSVVLHTYFKHLIRNPRELKKCFNHLRFVLEQVEGQVCFTDLLSLSIIASKANPVYEHIKQTPEAYIGKGLVNDPFIMEKPKDVIKSFEEERKELLGSFDKKEEKLIRGLLGNIFPMLGYKHSPNYGVAGKDAAGRVSVPQRLYTALHYITPEGYISDQEVMQFISGELDRVKFLERILNEDADERFFEVMMHYSSKCKDKSLEVLSSIYDVVLKSQKLITLPEGNYGFMSGDIYGQMRLLTNKVISESDSKFELITSLINREENTPISVDILREAQNQIKNNHPYEPWITDEQLTDLNSIFENVAIKVLKQKMFFDNHLETRIFSYLKHSPKEKTKQFISDILKKDEGIIRVAEIITNTGSYSANGLYADIDVEYFSGVLDLDILRKKAEDVNLEEQTISVQAALKSIITGKKILFKRRQTGKQLDDTSAW